MFGMLLALHSFMRWLVLISLLLSIFKAYKGWFGNNPFSKTDHTIRHVTATIVHVQLILGISLYYLSPVVDYFLKHFKEAVHMRQIRFFGMEHSSMMLVAVIFITVGSVKAKRQTEDKNKFKTVAIWYTIGLMIILSSIPWPFSPLTARPNFRAF